MARTRIVITIQPEWVKSMSDEEIVTAFRRHLDNPRMSYEQLGRQAASLGPRLYKVLIDGLHYQRTKNGEKL